MRQNVTIKSRLKSIFDYVKDRFSSFAVKVMFRTTSGGGSYYVSTSPEAYLAPVQNRIAVDVAMQGFRHALVDQNNTVIAEVDSDLNYCLSQEPNLDQTPFTFMHDLVLRLQRESIIAVVPIEYDTDNEGRLTKVGDLRVAKILVERPQALDLSVYNEETGLEEQITLPKHMVAIIENPLREVMSTQNATLKRVLDKINLLDTNDRKQNSGKLDMIIQLPYAIKTTTRKALVDERMKELEEQLSKSDLGIAYADSTEKIVQLNRTVGGNLMQEIAELDTRLYNQLGITENFMIGNATPDEVRNYYARTITPVTRSITEALTKVFVPKSKKKFKNSGRTDIEQLLHEKVIAERDVLELVAVQDILTSADSLTRNEVLAPTEIRTRLGFRRTGNPDADVVRNRNMPLEDSPQEQPVEDETIPETE